MATDPLGQADLRRAPARVRRRSAHHFCWGSDKMATGDPSAVSPVFRATAFDRFFFYLPTQHGCQPHHSTQHAPG